MIAHRPLRALAVLLGATLLLVAPVADAWAHHAGPATHAHHGAADGGADPHDCSFGVGLSAALAILSVSGGASIPDTLPAGEPAPATSRIAGRTASGLAPPTTR